ALLERHREALEVQRAELAAEHKLQMEIKTEAIRRECDALVLIERDRCRRQVREESRTA
ncbi:conserved hypothetical protein, partial [Perkinsus marinus ATCC 50983]